MEVGVRVDIDLAFKALADPIRRALLEALKKTEFYCRIDGESVNGICVQDLSGMLNLPQSTVSRHLAILRQAGLVEHQQKGVWHYYFCNVETLKAVESWITTLINKGSRCKKSASSE
ncbi:ArsR/SmtB family transcription factor [Sulfoacidibacillus thermotolerans]|uniref:HTH arsR-type domain-containing protein n=1 Tax=Sulfoacidibacillus thermotolerans TaxID=1765684 RepID=A0A2U3D699_SULT2|nr:metalloregulator ArsR/SmtB family transcription factor [Sulfoacidibacillus thermotolerans]PWI56794.1 hypothetical protein BM613_12000 [Sulfoacidibacillus thermotolerans]